MSQEEEQRDYWDSFYSSRASNAVPDEPSAFARWTASRLPTGAKIAEFGFGNARDSLWFAREGFSLLGYDFAPSAVNQAQGHADGREVQAQFSMLDLYDDDACGRVATMLSSEEVDAVYGRFLVHSLRDEGRHNLLDLAASGLGGGRHLYLEFRTGKDAEGTHLFGDDHFRVYLDPAVVETEIESRGGTITHSEADHGLAVYKTEDPHVARIVARWA